jgi:hypothetical protein
MFKPYFQKAYEAKLIREQLKKYEESELEKYLDSLEDELEAKEPDYDDDFLWELVGNNSRFWG